jgi:hypothetical protein
VFRDPWISSGGSAIAVIARDDFDQLEPAMRAITFLCLALPSMLLLAACGHMGMGM